MVVFRKSVRFDEFRVDTVVARIGSYVENHSLMLESRAGGMSVRVSIANERCRSVG